MCMQTAKRRGLSQSSLRDNRNTRGDISVRGSIGEIDYAEGRLGILNGRTVAQKSANVIDDA